MKKCCFCRRDLLPHSGVQCDKCKKNEAKYGKPTICKYCNLPAAFLDQKCVHCSYSERKYGAPRPCSRCQSKSAFLRDASRPPKVLLCRLCQAVHGTNNSSSKPKRNSSNNAAPEESPLKKLKETSQHSHHSSSHHQRHSSHGTSNGGILPTSTFETAANIQSFKDKISDLNRSLVDKSNQIKELQMKVVQLESEQMRKDKEYRQKLSTLEKQSDTTISSLQDQIKQLNKELASKTKQK